MAHHIFIKYVNHCPTLTFCPLIFLSCFCFGHWFGEFISSLFNSGLLVSHPTVVSNRKRVQSQFKLKSEHAILGYLTEAKDSSHFDD